MKVEVTKELLHLAAGCCLDEERKTKEQKAVHLKAGCHTPKPDDLKKKRPRMGPSICALNKLT